MRDELIIQAPMPTEQTDCIRHLKILHLPADNINNILVITVDIHIIIHYHLIVNRPFI